MSLKSIDSQMALSRMQESSVIQNQLNHKPMDDQSAASIRQMKQTEAERMRSNQVDKSDESQIRDGNGGGGGGASQGNRKERQPGGGQPREQHPYKGKVIDLSL